MATGADGFIAGTRKVTNVEGLMAKRVAYSGGLPVYEGFAPAGTATSAASWQIKRNTWTNNQLTAVEWADGNTNFDNVWDNRASLSYS